MDCVPSGVLGHAYVDLVVVADVEDPLSGYVLPLCHGGEDTASVLSQAEVGARVHRCDRVGTDDGVEDAVQVCLVQVVSDTAMTRTPDRVTRSRNSRRPRWGRRCSMSTSTSICWSKPGGFFAQPKRSRSSSADRGERRFSLGPLDGDCSVGSALQRPTKAGQSRGVYAKPSRRAPTLNGKSVTLDSVVSEDNRVEEVGREQVVTCCLDRLSKGGQ